VVRIIIPRKGEWEGKNDGAFKDGQIGNLIPGGKPANKVLKRSRDRNEGVRPLPIYGLPG